MQKVPCYIAELQDVDVEAVFALSFDLRDVERASSNFSPKKVYGFEKKQYQNGNGTSLMYFYFKCHCMP